MSAGPAFAAGGAEHREQGCHRVGGKAAVLGCKWALVSSHSARPTLQITEQEVRLVQLGGQRERTVPRTIRLLLSLFCLFSILYVTWVTLRSTGKQVAPAASSFIPVQVNFLRFFNSGHLSRSRSSFMRLKGRNYRCNERR